MIGTICMDFDGVFHKYKNGWQGEEIIEKPVEGIQEFLKRLYEDGWIIVIFSTRATTSIGKNAIQRWLQDYELDKYISKVDCTKPPAWIYLDDRGVTFEGKFDDELYKKINKFVPWNLK